MAGHSSDRLGVCPGVCQLGADRVPKTVEGQAGADLAFIF
jgi:hypothetical protein